MDSSATLGIFRQNMEQLADGAENLGESWECWMILKIPSGKRLHNYGKIHHFLAE